MSTSYQHIETEIKDHVGWIWLNRPKKKNALSADMWSDLPQALHTLSEDPQVRVLVIAGRGDSFTVGIDLEFLAGAAPKAPSPAARNMAFYQQLKTYFQSSFTSFAQVSQPVIASIHGYCLGGGVDLISACDIRLASADAIFSIRETVIGMVADVGTLQRLPRIIGPGRMAELAYTGMDIGADRAYEIGLLEHVYPDVSQLHDKTQQLADSIAANSPFVVAGIKRVLAAGAEMNLDQALDYAALWNAAMIETNDMNEALEAMRERRSPHFTGS